ncbi:MAG: alpha/beta hydrolase [Pirellulales bacterium]|nr:alpha/beta hydrolase [Pirellulales bacterium]
MIGHAATLAHLQHVQISATAEPIEGDLAIPADAIGVVLFAHGSGSSRHSPRNQFVAQSLQSRRMGTLLIDLLTVSEERADLATAEFRFDIELLRIRLLLATDWLQANPATRDLPIAYFGASTGAAAALEAAAQRPEIVAVVSRGGRPDLARHALRAVRAATLLIVGDLDFPIIPMNRAALEQLEQAQEKELALVTDAAHLFEEPGALDEVARLSGDWLERHFTASRDVRRAPR